MSTIGIRPQDSVLLIERRGEQEIVHEALVLSIGMHQSQLGTKGQPAIEAVFVNLASIRHAGTGEWYKALTRAHDVVHLSHKDWAERRTALAYMERIQPDEILAARAAHEANRIVCALWGDLSQAPWDDSPEWQKDSAIAGVGMIAAHPETTPEESHASWSALKLSQGWKYGPTKDADKKEHPCLVPYAELPPSQQVKDYMFGAVVRGVLGLTQLPTTFPQPASTAPQGAAPEETQQTPPADLQGATVSEPKPRSAKAKAEAKAAAKAAEAAKADILPNGTKVTLRQHEGTYENFVYTIASNEEHEGQTFYRLNRVIDASSAEELAGLFLGSSLVVLTEAAEKQPVS